MVRQSSIEGRPSNATSEPTGTDPAVEAALHPPSGIFSRSGLAVFRILLGLLWLDKVGARVPPDFIDLAGSVGAGELGSGSDPVARLVRGVIASNVEFLGWIVLAVEVALGVFLLLGLTTRLWAGVGVVQSLLILATVAGASHVWLWTYILMAAAHLAVLASAAGRTFGLDGLLRPGWIETRSRMFARFS
jgi:thiosulfate dehydrogenase [quinone] large subunit